MPQILRTLFFLTVLTVAVTTASTSRAQWTLQDTHTTADLRGIVNVGNGVAWASGSDGTILRTEDAGIVWQLCAKPPNAEHLDFRAIQAFDNNTAIIMSSGKGDLSRLYKTTDGCQTWKLLFTNPDKDGFWDGMTARKGFGDPSGFDLLVVGDPVDGKFTLFAVTQPSRTSAMGIYPAVRSNCHTPDYGPHGLQLAIGLCPGGRLEAEGSPTRAPIPLPGEGLFAASNSILSPIASPAFVTGGPSGPRFISHYGFVHPGSDLGEERWGTAALPLARSESAGAFSIAANRAGVIVAVGGDYKDPNRTDGTAAYSIDDRANWAAAATPPHGYRSAVAYDAPTKTWITVGPNGTDISTDDGRNWRALKPNPKFNDTPDADQHWNALSLPYVVGPHGRIATLRPSALKPSRP